MRTSSLAPLLDEGFDDVGDYESLIASQILKNGYFEPHPDCWVSNMGENKCDKSRLDYLTAKHEELLDNTSRQREILQKRKREDAATEAARQRYLDVKAALDAEAQRSKIRTKDIVASFPHADEVISADTMLEWHSFGEVDAANRGICKYEWLWKRSRFMAGFR